MKKFKSKTFATEVVSLVYEDATGFLIENAKGNRFWWKRKEFEDSWQEVQTTVQDRYVYLIDEGNFNTSPQYHKNYYDMIGKIRITYTKGEKLQVEVIE